MDTENKSSNFSSDIRCSPCLFEGKTNHAIKWCTECQEGLCKDCLDNHRALVSAKKHKVIPMQEYVLTLTHISPSEINTNCADHGRKLELFCPAHDEPVCTICIPEKHRHCENFIPIKEIAEHWKHTEAFQDIQNSLSDTKHNIENIISTCLENKTSLTLGKASKQQDMKALRRKVNEYLDGLEIKMLQNMEERYKDCIKEIDSSLTDIEHYKTDILKLNSEIDCMKNLTSKEKCFLGTRNIENKIIKLKRNLENRMDDMRKFEISVSFDPIFASLRTMTAALGTVQFDKLPMSMEMRDCKHRQAQIPILRPHSTQANTVLSQKQEIAVLPNVQNHLVTGCLILPNDLYLFVHRNGNSLVVQDKTGNVNSTVSISGSPYDVAILDDKHMVISYGSLAYIEVVALSNDQLTKRMPVNGHCSGICCFRGIIYVAVRQKGICTLSMGKNVNILIRCITFDVGYVAASNEKLVYTDSKHRSVHCHDLLGVELWNIMLNDMQCPRGVQIDIRGNILFCDSKSNNVTRVLSDGTGRHILLETSSGLKDPFGLHLDESRKHLLICNLSDGRAFSFNVK
ncbi:unnamed protein product [Mytilus coruscus]|uniref:B box-type domain-containing protein n=1 Tax=Mytilus coruscus TaxID=42192 RepID=A0A6J8EDJ4_MYTCO|nr:unnamed protein product [Mytilus coruscus]